ncbi:hypothetical protein NKG94_34935 [Micromonospora sp. M12]
MAREAHALRTIAERGDPRYLPYVPRLVDEFRHRDAATGAERRITVLATAPGLHDLDEVRRAYPTGWTPGTWPGCGGGCWWCSAWPTGRAWCTARSCRDTC